MPILTKQTANQTLLEEVLNASIHGVGVLLGIIGLTLLIKHDELHGNNELMISVIIYGCTLILMYGISMLYHLIQTPMAKSTFRIFDHSAIYLLIAGTYTPFTLISIGGVWGWSLFVIVWFLAITGVFYKIFFIGRWPSFSIGLYICMGWLALIAIRPVFHDLPFQAIEWIFAGGACYTFGVIFFMLDHKFHFFHALWHLCVLAGSACHFYAVLYYVKT